MELTLHSSRLNPVNFFKNDQKSARNQLFHTSIGALVEDVLQNWVRKRAFDHIEQGVMLKGDNVQEAKLVVDKIKVC